MPHLRSAALIALLALPLVAAPLLRAQQSWITPTPEELHMTSLPEQPGAKAVLLNVDELADDDNHMRSYYRRIKILTEAGKGLGDVHVIFDKRYDGRGWTVEDIAGRTIQPDGTIVPLTGKAFDKLLEKNKEDVIRGKTFTMPAVQVGSIIEYHYKLRWEDNIFIRPFWDVQDEDIFTRKGHFLWKPTNKELVSTGRGGRESYISTLVWHPVLPKGTEVKRTVLPTGRQLLELNVTNIPAFSAEENMPPMAGAMYHVDFYYSQYHTAPEFWATEGKYWSSDANKYIGNSGYIRDEANKAIAGAATDEDKLRKLYALSQSIENTDFTRKRDTAEEKSAGLKEANSAEDILRRKRGTSDEITRVFVALARAVGLNASLMASGDRSRNVVDINWLEFGQLRDEIAIVNYNGADHFFDPGSPYTSFGHLHWTHTFSGGVRQKDKETAIIETQPESYKYSHTARVADLKLDPTGAMTGTVRLEWTGSPAEIWRQKALRSDKEELREDMKKLAESMMPGGTEVTVRGVEGLTDGDTPLKALFVVNGHLGTSAGSRVVLPADIFVAAPHTTFPHEHRDQPVYLHYPEWMQDAVRITIPDGYTIESAPKDDKQMYKQAILYSQRSKQTPNSITVWRDLTVGDFFFPTTEYPELRTFYNNFERKDHESVVLKRAATDKASVQ